jgi:hypothetical protein
LTFRHVYRHVYAEMSTKAMYLPTLLSLTLQLHACSRISHKLMEQQHMTRLNSFSFHITLCCASCATPPMQTQPPTIYISPCIQPANTHRVQVMIPVLPYSSQLNSLSCLLHMPRYMSMMRARSSQHPQSYLPSSRYHAAYQTSPQKPSTLR